MLKFDFDFDRHFLLVKFSLFKFYNLFKGNFSLIKNLFESEVECLRYSISDKNTLKKFVLKNLPSLLLQNHTQKYTKCWVQTF